MSLISFSSLFAAKKTAQKQNQKQKQVARYESYVDAEPEMEDEVRDPSKPHLPTVTLHVDESIVEEDIPPLKDESAVAKDGLPEMQNGCLHVDIGIPGVERELTQKYIRYYQGAEGRKVLAHALKNSVPYRPYVIQSLEKNNLPAYLQYLPVVESDYKPTAISRSGATGIWQFMTNSMAPLMKKGKWFDDRRDPWLSTDAAMLKFKDNYSFFHDWTLAIAAYNCGAGGLLRLTKANPGMDYWEMSEKKLLKAETINYIPKLIAVVEIVENAGYYGLDDIKEAAELIKDSTIDEFDYIQTKTMLSFSQLSKATGLPVEKIKSLNLALLQENTPLGEAYNLRLPKGFGADFRENLKKMGLSIDSQIHTVEKGDTLWAISRKYEVTVAQLCTANGMKENDTLSIGKKIVVPIF